ncbi:EamA family transporter [Heliobacterium gestii]|uniref:EamA family transporter n=1 Tax=Heliomicrobium gestii TaxID=2699 RepID=A0A845LJ41_HELGE|nr:EamA family transporter [Heliomicrobium gestii]MBM7868432.1 drug/metabolite transporter (DMT)-like permease [Heliomicrobium gestii]MZP44579.1 EamA family transporter [Heliomicrobium gestii]
MGPILVIISALGFGSMAIFAAIAYNYGVQVPTVLAVRFCLAAALLWAIVIVRRENYRVDRKTLAGLFLLGAVGYGSMSFFFFTAVQRLTPGLAALLLYTYPVLVYVLSLLLGREKAGWANLSALTAAAVGTVLVLGASLNTVAFDSIGAAFGLSAAIMYSAYLLMGARIVQGVSPLVTTAYICTFAALVFIVCGLFSGDLRLDMPAEAYGAILAIAVICTAVAILALMAGIERVGPAQASIISTVEPVWTVFLSYLIFGERLNLSQMGGGALILLGVVILQAFPSKPLPVGGESRRGDRRRDGIESPATGPREGSI